jgi:hypothetical protein
MTFSAKRSGAVVPSDSTALVYKRLYVGGAGNVVIQHEGADSVTTFPSVPAGTFMEVSGCRVMAATTATNLVWMDY